MKSFLAYCSLIAAGAGCAKQDEPLSAADSQSAGLALSAGVEDAVSSFGPFTSAQLTAGCVTLSGDVTDGDSDHIPTSATLTYNCSETSLGFTGMVTGTIMVTDDQPNAVAWAFTGNADLHASLTAPSSAAIVSDRKGQLVGSQGSATGPFDLARSLDVTTTFKAANGNSIAVVENTDWSISYTPQATWKPGDVAVAGTVTASGMWHVAVGPRSANATIATPTPLTLTPGCSTRVTGGTVTGTFEGGGKMNTIAVSWAGCGQSTVTFTQN